MLMTTMAALLAGCATQEARTPDADSGEPPVCEAYEDSVCDNPASLVQGRVTLPDGASQTSGDLVIAMMHRHHGDPAAGGHPHWMWTFEDVDLSEPYDFEVDMCDGNAIMWSEENCAYNLIAILDENGNNGLPNRRQAVPDIGEAAAMIVMDLSCHADGPTCVDMALSCTDGRSCVTFEAPEACDCAAESCDSQVAICQM